MVMRSRRRSISRRSNRRKGEERQRSRRRSRMRSRRRSRRRSKKGKMEGSRGVFTSNINDTETMRRQISVMERSIGPPISASRSRSSSPSSSRSQRPTVVQGRRVSPRPTTSPMVASPAVARPRSKSPGVAQTRPRAPSRSRASPSPSTPVTSSPPTSPRTSSSMKKGRRRSVVEDLPGIDARTMAEYSNSLSAEERRKKGLPTSSRFKSTFTKPQIEKIMKAYDEQWKSEHPLGALSTPDQKAYAKARRVVNTGEPGSTPGMKVSIPHKTGVGFIKGSYDTLATAPPLTEAERKGLMEAARKARGKNKLPMMEEKAGGGASRSKSPVHIRDSSEFSDGFIEEVYYYSETYRDWLNAELIIDGDDFKMRIITPDAGPRYIYGNLTDSAFKQRIKGKIYIKVNRSYKLHPVKDRLNK